MISVDLARELRGLGMIWRPVSGDCFVIDRAGFDGEVFVVSDMTIQSLEFDTGTILGFNGTTEWALDSVALEDTLWLPQESQLRQLLGEAFLCLARSVNGFSVTIDNPQRTNAGDGGEAVKATGAIDTVSATSAADAYAAALLVILRSRP